MIKLLLKNVRSCSYPLLSTIQYFLLFHHEPLEMSVWGYRTGAFWVVLIWILEPLD